MVVSGVLEDDMGTYGGPGVISGYFRPILTLLYGAKPLSLPLFRVVLHGAINAEESL